ncbi:hypothetical protein SAMN05444281_1533 [Wenyingzhuangia marina]|uniref:Uncharacterized protein n=1 Tax=Wenyingzhuangia marina TaxID=1195760 RepID=A0A1M5V5P7_9FLAO|nr:hypothetical protein SAMN05444281_1533 [Wenyingzhuangia marina]
MTRYKKIFDILPLEKKSNDNEGSFLNSFIFENIR